MLTRKDLKISTEGVSFRPLEGAEGGSLSTAVEVLISRGCGRVPRDMLLGVGVGPERSRSRSEATRVDVVEYMECGKVSSVCW